MFLNNMSHEGLWLPRGFPLRDVQALHLICFLCGGVENGAPTLGAVLKVELGDFPGNDLRALESRCVPKHL